MLLFLQRRVVPLLVASLVSISAAAPEPPSDAVVASDAAEIKTSCMVHVVRVDGPQTWTNADNIRFYSEVLRVQPRVLQAQRDHCGLTDCNDLGFLLPLFKHVPGAHNLLPTSMLQGPGEPVALDIVEVGAHDGRVIDWYLANTSKGTIYAVEHVPELVSVLERKYKGNPRVVILAMSFLDPRIPQLIPKVDGVISAWSAHLEFTEEEQRENVFRSHALLKDPGFYALDLPMNPLLLEEGQGGYREAWVRGVRVPLRVHIPTRKQFLILTLDKEEGGAGFNSLGFFEHNMEREPRYFFVFEKDERVLRIAN